MRFHNFFFLLKSEGLNSKITGNSTSHPSRFCSRMSQTLKNKHEQKVAKESLHDKNNNEQTIVGIKTTDPFYDSRDESK